MPRKLDTVYSLRASRRTIGELRRLAAQRGTSLATLTRQYWDALRREADDMAEHTPRKGKR
jgi:hypothetical protein